MSIINLAAFHVFTTLVRSLQNSETLYLAVSEINCFFFYEEVTQAREILCIVAKLYV